MINSTLPAILALIGLFLVVSNIQAIQQNFMNIPFWIGAAIVVLAIKLSK